VQVVDELTVEQKSTPTCEQSTEPSGLQMTQCLVIETLGMFDLNKELIWVN